MIDLATIAAHLAGNTPKVVRRSWRERLFSRPWRPWVRMKMVWEPAPVPLEVRRRAPEPETFINPCLHCALLGTITLWHKTYCANEPPLNVRAHVLAHIDQTMDSLEASWAGKPMTEH